MKHGCVWNKDIEIKCVNYILVGLHVFDSGSKSMLDRDNFKAVTAHENK